MIEVCTEESCRRKRGYTTAWEAARTAEYRSEKGGVPLIHYACTVCGLWHLTKRVDIRPVEHARIRALLRRGA